ncbi:dehydrogenase with different specificitie [Delphinella strobiligena]|nr:dehydrogenase with different specificitie [Delphinella strobiligena]
MSLKGKIAIVTGASRGIGSAIALSLAKEGCSIAIVYTSPSSTSSAEEVQSSIRAYNNGADALLVRSDLASPDCGLDIVQQTLRGFNISDNEGNEQRIDIIVHNAGIWLPGNSLEFSCDAFEKVMNFNVRSAALLVKAYVPYMPVGGGGRIISISAYFASHGMAGQDIYSASKAALEALTRCWTATFGREKGITANSIAVGYIPTDMNKGLPDELVESMAAKQAASKKPGDRQDVADVVVWMAGSGSRWITGDVLKCDGGYVLA